MEANQIIGFRLSNSKNIEECIYEIRGYQVMLDSDIAFFFDVEVRRLNEQMKRNIERFPDDFCFQLNSKEFKSLRSQNATFNLATKERKYRPFVYTEHGIIALAGVLKSDIAAKMSVEIARKFIQMRKFIFENGDVLLALARLQNRQLEFEAETSKRFDEILKLINHADLPKQAVFNDGQFYSAYEFVSAIIGKAKDSILLIDPYFDAKAFVFLKNKANEVSLTVCKSSRSRITDEEISLFESEQGPISMKTNDLFHDRFLIIDAAICYSLGASLNYMGKRVFAINRIDDNDIINALIAKANS